MLRHSILISLFFSFSTYAWGTSDLDQAKQQLQKNHLKEALSQTEAILIKTPDDADALFTLGIILTKMTHKEEAMETFEQLVEKYPQLPEPRNNLAVLYAQQGQFQEAERALQSAIDTHPSYATAHSNLSDIYKKLASMAYNKALNLKNSDTPSLEAASDLNMVEELYSYQPRQNKQNNKTEVSQLSPDEIAPAITKTGRQSDPKSNSDKPNPADINNIEETVFAWAQAWSHQDVESYLGHYSPDYSPKRISREEWTAQRGERLRSPDFIQVDITNLKVKLLDNQIASVSFKQRYHSNRFAETTQKLLLMKRHQQQWQIVDEAETK